MTCIVALEADGKVWMGADASVSTGGMEIRGNCAPKICIRQGLIFGSGGSLRYTQMIQYLWDIPAKASTETNEHYMFGTIPDSLDAFLIEHHQDCDTRQEDGSVIMVGYKGKLYSYGPALGAVCPVEGFDVIGIGEKFALGSLAETNDALPTNRIRRALCAAERFSGGVLPPFHIISL